MMNLHLPKLFHVLSAFMFFICAMHGQRPYDKESIEKIRSMKIAYLTDQLDISADEAKLFWPVYEDFEKKMDMLHSKEWSLIENNQSSDDVKSKETLVQLLQIEEDECRLKKEYLKKINDILGTQRLLRLKKFERDFKRELLRKMREPNSVKNE